MVFRKQINNVPNPFNFSNYFFTDELKNNIIRKTNKYARAKIANKNLSIY